MAKAAWKFLMSTSLVASMSAITAASSFAASLTNPTVSGTAGTDYLLYKQVGNQTVRDDSASLSTVLEGSAASPGGNVELFANSETSLYTTPFSSVGLTNFKTAPITSLTGSLFGMNLILSSLNGADWFTTKKGTYDTSYGADNLANRWFKDVFAANGFSSVISLFGSTIYNTGLNAGVFQRFSDSNVSYVNQDTATSDIKIGLAGHFDAKTLLLKSLPSSVVGILGTKPLQASEVIKVTYGGVTQYKYSFNATGSGLTAADDGISHNGNYELTVQPVPEPTTMLGLALGASGLLAAKRKRTKIS
ncbi:NF038130 family PEP-CTERM protein [Microcoleus sp. Pol14C2]|uniref:NF038130 family PEP-CTERM protein n=1 Tax=unclassified Microcoleus TaxID=2642155 RepID=UPI002FD5034D